MNIRRARKEDFPQITSLARQLGLDYQGMDDDSFWVAEDGGRIAGIVALKKHADCHELCALGVHSRHRDKGLGRELVQVLLQSADRDIYLATIIPGFFENCGFDKTAHIPSSLKKSPEWCEGCSKELCTIMVRKRS
ncbi:MAG: GNAT family N-acetyltransferase [Candidatus Aminicenantes bacterium]|jgi:N-acetylglutamate synthase-like GNAT family acetyltransferase|nr:GNAT family N-acetyltransferase [Candidatus Aminicenantes bacterium]